MSVLHLSSYTLGFQNCAETREAQALKVEGDIPDWVQGTLFRNGPGIFDVAVEGEKETCSFHHWFDALTMLHKFRVEGNEVSYQSAHMVPECEAHIRECGRPKYLTFGQDPCATLFQKVTGMFRKPDSVRNPKNGEPLVNIGVTVDKVQDQWVQTTDAATLVGFDPETLEPKPVFSYPDLNPEFKGFLSAAHPQLDASTGEQFNFTLTFGPRSAFHLFCISPENPQGRLLTTIAQEPSYIHSMALTPRYLILVAWPLYFGWRGLKVVWEQNLVQSLEWRPEDGCRFYVIERNSGQHLGTWHSPTFFCFHHVNAFEQGDDLVLDMSTYKDAGLIEALKLYNLRDPARINIPEGRLDRFYLRDLHSRIFMPHQRKAEMERLCDHTVELPRINEQFHMQPYRYVYGVGNSGPRRWIDRIVKFDVETRSAIFWHEPGQWPAEPVFLAAPNAHSEDEGVLLSIVLHEESVTSSLLVLDAQTLRPLARAHVPQVVPYGFHGTWTGECW